ncbi:MAG: hypothetical protein HOE90_07265 [Bacteriovoracaceae bacterium]|nr:hypothetical protein [Bacteriovoracaceae bacterium]
MFFILKLLIGQNIGELFFISATSYYLFYEWPHFYYHLKSKSFLDSINWLYFLKKYHTLHHQKTKMNSWNFNLTIPVMDYLLKTKWKPPEIHKKN